MEEGCEDGTREGIVIEGVTFTDVPIEWAQRPGRRANQPCSYGIPWEEYHNQTRLGAKRNFSAQDMHVCRGCRDCRDRRDNDRVECLKQLLQASGIREEAMLKR